MSLIWGFMRVLALAVALILHLVAHGATRLLRLPSLWPRRFLAAVARISGAVVEVRGQPLRQDVLFVANHTNWLDIPIMAGATGTTFVATADVKDWPLVGWLASLHRTVFVDRGNRLGVQGQVGAVRKALGQHQPVAIFPEGTTSDGANFLPFKPALLEVVSPPPRAIRVQPLLLDYGAARDLAWIGDEPALANAWRVLTRPGRFTVRLYCLDSFDPLDFGDRKAIAAEARRRILAAFAKARPGV
jgi:lyso-ornithine lipid O-acyltransferase